MELAAYPEYKESGVPWLPVVPANWRLERAKNLFAESNLPVRKDDEIVTCFRDGQVTLRKNRRERGFMNALLEVGYQGVRTGQLVVHAMDALAGAIGVSDSDGKCTPEYVILNTRITEVDLHYYALVLREMARLDYIRVVCPAVRERAPRLRYPNLAAMYLPVPGIEVQERIVKFSHSLKSRIGKFIRNKRRLIELLQEHRTVLTYEAMKSKETKWLRFGVVAVQVERPIGREDDLIYRPIGLYNRGRGIFHKEATQGRDLGDSSFFWVKPGDLVFSGQFAWEGAVAIAQPEDEGCIASHRYPIFQNNPEMVEAAFLYSFFTTKDGDLLLNLNSRGAAGRNRPLNPRTLMKEKIPIPPVHLQKQISELLELERKVRSEVASQISYLQEYRTRLISDVVTGQVDVRGIEVPEVAEEELLALEEDTAEAEEITDEELEMEVEE